MSDHTFRLNGRTYAIRSEAIRAALAAQIREDVREHWVEVDGVRWPVKQVFAAITGLRRDAFTSHTALRHLRALALPTSMLPRADGSADAPPPLNSVPERVGHRPVSGPDPAEAFGKLLAFVGSADLTARIASLEARFNGVDRTAAAGIADDAGIGLELLLAALLVRQHAGRLSDIIHAAVIAQVLPLILEDGERVVRRPSLAAGNDPSRPYDLETDRRIAEFKMAVWKGADTMRRRGAFADLVHLALDTSGRRAQLYVAGQPAIRFLRNAKLDL